MDPKQLLYLKIAYENWYDYLAKWQQFNRMFQGHLQHFTNTDQIFDHLLCYLNARGKGCSMQREDLMFVMPTLKTRQVIDR